MNRNVMKKIQDAFQQKYNTKSLNIDLLVDRFEIENIEMTYLPSKDMIALVLYDRINMFYVQSNRLWELPACFSVPETLTIIEALESYLEQRTAFYQKYFISETDQEQEFYFEWNDNREFEILEWWVENE